MKETARLRVRFPTAPAGTLGMAAVLCACWAVVAAQPLSTTAARLERAGQKEAAWQEYRLAIERVPGDAAALRGYARLSLQLGRADSLVALCRRLQAADTGNPEFVLGLIQGLLGLGRRAEALTEARRVDRRWPGQLNDLVEVLKQGREYGAAGSLLAGRMAAAGFRPDLALMLVGLYELDKQYAAAVRMLVELANRDGPAAAKQFGRLRLYGSRGAGQVMSELTAINNPALRDKAQAQVQLGAGNQAEAVQLIARSHSAQELLDFGRECEREGFSDAALAAYRRVGATIDVARVLRQLGRRAEARQALTGDSTPAALLELAELLREERELGAAAEAYRKVLAAQPTNVRAREGLVETSLGLGRLDSARMVLSGLKLQSDRALFLEARILFYQGKLDSVRELVMELNRRFPQSRLVNDGLELALLCQAGERAAALAEAMLDYETGADEAGLRRAWELSRGDDVVAEQAHLLRAAILRRAGKPREALDVLDSALSRPKPGELRGRTMFLRAQILRDDLNDDARFRQTLEELVESLPASPWAPLARNLLVEAATPGRGGDVR